MRAAYAFFTQGYGRPILIAREDRFETQATALGLPQDFAEVVNSATGNLRERYGEFLYNRLKRQGFLFRDVQRMVNQNRNVFAACMVACGEADAMVTGLTRNFNVAYDDIRRVLDPKPGKRSFAFSIMVHKGRSVFLADTSVHELPSAEELADFAVQLAAQARAMGHEPRVALLSFSNFGNPPRERAMRIREAVEVLDGRTVDFEYDGEMSANVALNYELMRELYPFCRLTGPANVLIMPALHAANITTRMVAELEMAQVIGPLLTGLDRPAQIVPLGATAHDLVNAGAIAAYSAINDHLF
jgi:malate dehydrogenase (oxaloacetate-decarboxylating)(NADP+)